MAIVSLLRTASTMRATASSMPLNDRGSGNSSRSVGARKRSASLSVTPRPARMRPTISGTPSRCVSDKPRRTSPPRSRQRLPRSERSTPRKPRGLAALPSILLQKVEIALALEIVHRLDHAHGAALRAHDHRIRDGAVIDAAHALEHGAGGDTGGGEHDVAFGQILQAVFAVEIVDTEAPGAAFFVVVAEQQPPLHEAADAAQSGGGQDAFWRAARTYVDVDAAVGPRGGNDSGDVAVGDQHDARTGRANLADQIAVSRPIENADHQVRDGDLLCLGKIFEVLRRRRVDVDDPVADADCDLIHVDVGCIEEAAGLGHGDDGERVLAAFGGDRRAFEWVERDVDLRPLPGADFLADVQHWRFVALTLADHDGAFDGEAVEGFAHGVDRRLVGGFLVAPAHQPGRRQRRSFGDAYRLKRQIAVHAVAVVADQISPLPYFTFIEPRCGSCAVSRARISAGRCGRAPGASAPRPWRAW